MNNLHLFVAGTTSMAGRFVVPAILIPQILICSLLWGFDCYCERKTTTKKQGLKCVFVRRLTEQLCGCLGREEQENPAAKGEVSTCKTEQTITVCSVFPRCFLIQKRLRNESYFIKSVR